MGKDYLHTEDTAVEMVLVRRGGTDEEGAGVGGEAGNLAKKDQLSVDVDLQGGLVQPNTLNLGVGEDEKEMIPRILATSDPLCLFALNRGRRQLLHVVVVVLGPPNHTQLTTHEALHAYPPYHSVHVDGKAVAASPVRAHDLAITQNVHVICRNGCRQEEPQTDLQCERSKEKQRSPSPYRKRIRSHTRCIH